MVGRLPDIGSVGGDRKARQQAEGESNDKQKELILRKQTNSIWRLVCLGPGTN